tara:strand:+ start:1227 stop:1427 length:201 start_codon:yes stop_codon:yes gene_type:complete
MEESFARSAQQEKFAMLVAARVNEILSGDAKVLEFSNTGGVFLNQDQENLLFADLIARAVCANIER